MAKAITIETIVNAPVNHVWKCWNEPEHITKWAFASDTWEAPAAKNDLRVGGSFVTVMAAKDGSAKFDFSGVYSAVKPNELIEYSMADGRKVSTGFESMGDKTKIVETFDMENENPEEMQRSGWQAILNNFKAYAESVK